MIKLLNELLDRNMLKKIDYIDSEYNDFRVTIEYDYNNDLFTKENICSKNRKYNIEMTYCTRPNTTMVLGKVLDIKYCPRYTLAVADDNGVVDIKGVLEGIYEMLTTLYARGKL